MIKSYNGYEAKKSSSGAREILPAGGYVAKVLGTSIEDTRAGQMLVISFDIEDGEYKGFFKKDYAENTNETKKWRGNYRLFIPKDDGSDKDAWSKKTMNNMAAAFEESNNGYVWDWDEQKLKGKLVGVLFRDKEWEKDGKTGWTTECCALTDVQTIKDNKFKMPKPKSLPSGTVAAQFTPVEEEDTGDLPF